MSQMGFRSMNEMVGRVDLLDMRRVHRHWKAGGVDLSRLLYAATSDKGAETPLRHVMTQDHGLDKALDNDLIAACQPALETGEAVRIKRDIRNVNRTAGTMLSGEIAKKHGHQGLEPDTIRIELIGTAGQSFAAWLAHGVTLDLTGDANDYVGKGLSGGRVIVRPPENAPREPGENIIVGNTVLYGAIAGEAYFHGVAGERFAVRNSGAIAVVEGAGDHACEYMTGGVVCVLGETGRNFAAGMSGGVAYVYDPDGTFEERCNTAQVEILTMDEAAQNDAAGSLGEPEQRTRSVGDMGMGDPLYHDAERLRVLVERHQLHTGSAKAAELLADWDAALSQFKKVMPLDYTRALKALEAERLEAETVAAE